jgi:hypothetical protein
VFHTLLLWKSLLTAFTTGSADPFALPVADALVKIAEAEGDLPSAFSGLAPVLASLKIRTLIDLLDCGNDKWATIKEAAGPLGPSSVVTVLQMKAAVESLQALAQQSKLPGDLAAIGIADRIAGVSICLTMRVCVFTL